MKAIVCEIKVLLMKWSRNHERISINSPPRRVGSRTEINWQRSHLFSARVVCGAIVALFSGLTATAVRAQAPPPYGANGWMITSTGSETVQFQGAQTQPLTTFPDNSTSLNSFYFLLPAPYGAAASGRASVANASAEWAINCIYNGSNGLPDPASAPPVVVELYSEAQASWSASGNSFGRNLAADALGGVSTAVPFAFVKDDKYLVFQPSNGQFSLGTLKLQASCTVAGAQALGVDGELDGIIFNYPEVAGTGVSEYYSKGAGGIPVPDAYQPDGSITVDLPLTVAQSAGTSSGSTDTMLGQFNLFYNDNTDSVNKPYYTFWTAKDSGPTTTLLDRDPGPLSFQPVSGGATYSLTQVRTTEVVTAPNPVQGQAPTMPSLGSTTIEADLEYGVNPAGDPLPDLSNVMNINWHYQLENPVSVGTPLLNWVNDPSFAMVPPPAPDTGYPPGAAIPYTVDSAAGSDAGTAEQTALQTYAPGVFSILSALTTEFPEVAALFAGVGGAASLFPPGTTVQAYLDWADLWTPSSISTPTYIHNGGSWQKLPSSTVEDNYVLTNVTSEIELKNNYYTMDKYAANGYQGQYPIDIRYQVGRRYYPTFTDTLG